MSKTLFFFVVVFREKEIEILTPGPRLGPAIIMLITLMDAGTQAASFKKS